VNRKSMLPVGPPGTGLRWLRPSNAGQDRSQCFPPQLGSACAAASRPAAGSAPGPGRPLFCRVQALLVIGASGGNPGKILAGVAKDPNRYYRICAPGDFANAAGFHATASAPVVCHNLRLSATVTGNTVRAMEFGRRAPAARSPCCHGFWPGAEEQEVPA